MAGYHSFIGYPWIIDCLVKYDSVVVKQKPVPGQVVEFLRMPGNSEACQYPEAIVHISDQKYYIRAVITKEAQQLLERDDEHFTLVDIKNKIIILKSFCVCFTAVEDLSRCEFYLTVKHFSVLPMETNRIDILNCNMEPGVRDKIKKLWQNYMAELEMNENSHDMILSDMSLTQLLAVVSEEKFSALKSIAEQCLELYPFSTQDIPPQSKTFWSLERKRNQENTERFAIPVDLLLIPPHEEEVLEQMTEFCYEGQNTSEPDYSEEENSSQPYSTALSTLSEDPIDEVSSSQSGNPWNKLQSLCVSVAISSDSQPKSSSFVQKGKNNEVESAQDSSTPDIFISDAEVSMGDSPTGKSEISPLMFSEHSSNPQQPSTSKSKTDNANSNTSSNGRPGRSLNTIIACSRNILPLTQDPPQRCMLMESKVQMSPVKSLISESKSSTAIKTELVSLSDESNKEICWSLRTRKASKRKQTSQELEDSDLEHSSEEIDKVSGYRVQTVASKQIGSREAVVLNSDVEKNNRKTEQCFKTQIAQKPKFSKERIQAHKPSLQFIVNPKTLPARDSANEQLTTVGPTTSKVLIREASSSSATHEQVSFEPKTKSIALIIEAGKTQLAHDDGTPFQYKYKPPSENLCVLLNAIQIPADLCEWAVKMSENQEKVL